MKEHGRYDFETSDGQKHWTRETAQWHEENLRRNGPSQKLSAKQALNMYDSIALCIFLFPTIYYLLSGYHYNDSRRITLGAAWAIGLIILGFLQYKLSDGWRFLIYFSTILFLAIAHFFFRAI